MEEREEGQIRFSNAKEIDVGGLIGQCGWACIKYLINKETNGKVTIQQLKNEVAAWLNDEKNSYWKQDWEENLEATQETHRW